MYRLEVRRRLCVPRIKYKEERIEFGRQIHYAVLLKAASGPVTQDYSKIVSTLPIKCRPKGNEELKKLNGQMQVAGLLKEASVPAQQEYLNIVSTLPVSMFTPGGNDNLINLHRQLKKVILLKAAWQLVDKAVHEQKNENHRTVKRKMGNEDIAVPHKHRRVVKDTD